MRFFSASPQGIWLSFWRNRGLIQTLVKRDVVSRYRGSAMGILWSLFNPLLMLSVYTFVFSFVFEARWGSTSNSKTEFALVLFCGLIVFNLFAECINKAPGLMLANTNYVKKIIFPLEVLPWVSLGSALFHCLVSLAVWLVAYIVLFGAPHLTALLLPLVLAPFLLIIIGLSWLLASLGVYLRDVSQVIGILTTVLMFLSPIFYPVTALPDQYQSLLFINPITLVIEQVRMVLYWGKLPGPIDFALYLGAASIIAWAGFAWFQKTRKGFADVL